MQGGNGVARTGKRERFDEQFVDLGEAERLPRECFLENVDWAHGGKEVVEENADGAGDEKSRHGRQTAARVAEKQTRVDDRDDDGETDVEEEA